MRPITEGAACIKLIDPRTRAFLEYCFNFLLRSGAVALCWAGLFVIALSLNYMVSTVLGWLDMGENTLELVRAVTVGYVLIFAAGITLTAISETIRFTWASVVGGVESAEELSGERTEDSDR